MEVEGTKKQEILRLLDRFLRLLERDPSVVSRDPPGARSRRPVRQLHAREVARIAEAHRARENAPARPASERENKLRRWSLLTEPRDGARQRLSRLGICARRAEDRADRNRVCVQDASPLGEWTLSFTRCQVLTLLR